MAKGLIALVLLLAGLPAAAQERQHVDLRKPERPVPGPGEGMIVLRPFADTMAGDNRILIHRIDPATGAIATAAGKPDGVRIGWSYTVFGGRKGERALRVAILPAGDYVLAGRVFNGSFTDSFCFGAPRFRVAAGDVLYIGDYEMLGLAKMPDGERRNAMRYVDDADGARGSLATAYPALATRMRRWQPVNAQTFPCVGDEFTAYAVPGVR